MPAVWLLARARLRRRRESTIALALTVGLAAGTSLLALAGARRTDSAVTRFIAYEQPPEGSVDPQDPADQDLNLLAAVARLPQVAEGVRGAFMLAGTDSLSALAVLDTASQHALIVSGRPARADRADEVTVNASGAEHAHLQVGSTVTIQGVAPEDATAALRGTPVARSGPAVTLRVVGIQRLASDLSVAPAPPGVIFASNDFLYLTPAFFATYGARMANAGIGLAYRLKHGPADLDAFTKEVDQLSSGRLAVHEGSDDLAAADQARHATRIEALALLLFGLLAAVLAGAMVAQTLTRQAYQDAGDEPALRAMGVTRHQMMGAETLQAAVVGLAGAAVAVAAAILASPLMPIGLARQAEVSPGFSVDGLMLGVGAILIFLGVTAWASSRAWRLAGGSGPAGALQGSRAERPSAVAEWAGRSGLPASTSVGVRMALEPGRGATAVPVRTSLLGAVIAVAATAGSLIFGANLTRLAAQPGLQGWTWDVSVGNPHADDTSAQSIPLLDGNPAVAGFTAIAGGAGGVGAEVEGQPVDVFGIQTIRGSVLPPFPEGRAPQSADEIALAPKTLERLHRKVGDRVSVAFGPDIAPRSMQIVGRPVLTPAVVNNSMPLGEGGLVTIDSLAGLPPQDAVPVNVFLVRLSPTANRQQALARLRDDFPGTVLPASPPPDIENLLRVSGLPTLLAILFAGVALLTVGHTLVGSVRRRRRDLAILRTMGFVKGQVRAAVAWQATTVVLVGGLIGLPIGVVAGRWAWGLVDGRLGLPFDAVLPAAVLGLIVAAALLAANAVAAFPGAVAARTRPAAILRSE